MEFFFSLIAQTLKSPVINVVSCVLINDFNSFAASTMLWLLDLYTLIVLIPLTSNFAI